MCLEIVNISTFLYYDIARVCRSNNCRLINEFEQQDRGRSGGPPQRNFGRIGAELA